MTALHQTILQEIKNLLIIFMFIEFFQKGNLKFRIEKIFLIPLILLLLIYIVGPLLDIKIIKIINILMLN